MIDNVTDVKKALYQNRSDLAFIVGNGINRFAYNNEKNVSWRSLLLNVWRQLFDNGLNFEIKGISLTEFYDMMELEEMERVQVQIVELLSQWHPRKYHKILQSYMRNWDVPLLTTNFDRNLDDGLDKGKLGVKKDFSDYYPWNVYFSDRELTSPVDGFGVWHIHGMLDYKRSIRLGLSQYMALVARTRSFLHFEDASDNFRSKNQNYWKGYNTWLHIFFNRSLCIFGLALDEDETFLRWLLIERAMYFKKYPERRKGGWFVYNKKEGKIADGKRYYLNTVGIELVELDNYEDIYRKMLKP